MLHRVCNFKPVHQYWIIFRLVVVIFNLELRQRMSAFCISITSVLPLHCQLVPIANAIGVAAELRELAINMMCAVTPNAVTHGTE